MARGRKSYEDIDEDELFGTPQTAVTAAVPTISIEDRLTEMRRRYEAGESLWREGERLGAVDFATLAVLTEL